ncbi:trichohyalin-like isoform X2 [Adelges cooleyi]|uniref:trichohyalin-like isoform X2 n=1 Tax=Adelges cooleyi TaxID=133065 RepID=UPI00217FB5FE|nr:trichohyalin-like isoform X2 [Adelges cooleyi]
MHTIFVGDRRPSNRALVLSNCEWKRLGKLLTKKADEAAAVQEMKRVKEERRALSERLAKSWDTTVLNKRRKQLEQRKQLLAGIEAKQVKRDEQMNREILERRETILEKARLHKWAEKDSTKTLTSELRKTEVLRERAMQMQFNESEKQKALEEERSMAEAQKKETEQYEKHKLEQKLKEAQEKEANKKLFMEEARISEIKKREEENKRSEEEQAELRRIAKEIEEEKEQNKAKLQSSKESMMKNLNDSREIAAKKKQMEQLVERDEDMVIAILAEANKRIARTRKLKEIEIARAKQAVLEKIKEKVRAKQAKMGERAEMAFLNAVDEQERRYRREEAEKRAVVKKRAEEMEEQMKVMDQERRKEQERLALSFQWERQRREREMEVLKESDLAKKRAEHEAKKKFREYLDLQSSNNRAASEANKMVDFERYQELLRTWRQDDREFNAYAKEVLENCKEMGRPVEPILRAIKNVTIIQLQLSW